MMELSSKKVVASGHVTPSKDNSISLDVECKINNSSHKDKRQFMRNPNESDRTTIIEDVVDKFISMESRQTVECLLSQIRQLTSMEKLLLYLKLPNGKSAGDPLRQHMNPLGSRLEIHHTITWIKTHLQEDQEVSLPKQDVYLQYLEYCNSNSVKPLSTADFGKVMKQVYPEVRPRRLGTRGHSRYCYAGLRKRVRLAPPVLPDIGVTEKTALEDNGGGKAGSPERTVLTAVSLLIREWAEKALGQHFTSLQELACHLIQTMAVNNSTPAALTLLSTVIPPAPRSTIQSRSASSAGCSEGVPSSDPSFVICRPVSETPRSGADHKRKVHDDQERCKLKNPDSKTRSKRTKQRSVSSPMDAHPVGGRRSAPNNRPIAPPLGPVMDNSPNSQVYSVMYNNSKEGNPDNMQSSNISRTNGNNVSSQLMPMFSNTMASESCNPCNNIAASNSNNLSNNNNNLQNVDTAGPSPSQAPEGNHGGKLPIPRLLKLNNKQPMHNFILLPPSATQQQHQHQQSPSQRQKYKLIRPKPFPELEKRIGAEEDLRCVLTKRSRNSADMDSLGLQNGCLKEEDFDSIIPNGDLKPENSGMEGSEAIIGCLENDTLVDYLGGSNSQEQEEELMQYFPQQNPLHSQGVRTDGGNSVDKISQLRLLLERNLNHEAANKAAMPYHQNGMSAAASLSLLSQRSQQRHGLNNLPNLLTNQQQAAARRVSFEVPGDTDSAANSVPPSPNTKQRFSFTPISPRPYSPSKSHSANASPFVSPRNTPVPRVKMNHPHSTFISGPNAQQGQHSVGKPGFISGGPRTMLRSISVNSESSPFATFQAVNRPTRTMGDSGNTMHLDVKPDINRLHDMVGCQQQNNNNPYTLSGDIMNISHNLNSGVTPLHVSRNQFPVSMSAPQSPVVHSLKSNRSPFNLRKETRAHSFEMECNVQWPYSAQSLPTDQNTCFAVTDNNNHCQLPPRSNVPDKYSQEIMDVFSDAVGDFPSMSSSFRSQSVPLHRMANSVVVSPMPATALPSPLLGPQHSTANVFTFNPFTPVNSVAPTPVPSEAADFGVDSDGVLMSHSVQHSPVPDFGNEMMDGGNGCMDAGQEDGMGPDSLNPDILNEMFRMLEEGKSDMNSTYSNPTLAYKNGPECNLRGDPLFTSFRLHANSGENGGPDDQLTLGSASSAVASADPVLSELNGIADTSSSNILLEETPSSFITDDLECEMSQFAREVADTTS